MNELLEFLTSKEIIVVYIVAAVACALFFIIHLIDKTYYKRKRKHNTRELNKLVEEVNHQLEDEGYEEVDAVSYDTPVLQTIDTTEEELIEEEVEEETIEVIEPVQTLEPVVEEIDYQTEELDVVNEVKPEELDVEDIILETMTSEELTDEFVEEVEEVLDTEELTYTNIEPNKQEAQAELQRLTEELAKAEQEVNKNIDLTTYEEEQEENAIISLEELVKKSKEMYEQNELTQYADEGNEPISLADLEIKLQEYKTEEPTTVESIVEEIESLDEEPVIIETFTETEQPVIEQQKLVLDDFNTVEVTPVVEQPRKSAAEAYGNSGTFRRSPVISPIYGIEAPKTELELENTANYEKLDAEIKKTNDFLNTLKELQNNLD